MFSGTMMPWKTSMKKKYVSLWIQNILVGVRKGMLYWQSCKKATIAAFTLIREAFENTSVFLFCQTENLPGKKCFLLGIAQIAGGGVGGMHQKAIVSLLSIPVEHLKVLMTDYCIHKFIIDRNCTTNIARLISE